jgi:tripartite-type tricarboxylate transporter receptor subunit TctC
MTSMTLIRGALGALCGLAMATIATAADYPTRPIRLVVPFPPGGPSDFFARGLANAIKKHLDQPLVIDNKSGATGIVGADNVAKSPPDGYSILLGSPGTMSVAPSISETLPFDVAKDFVPITLVVKVPEAVVCIPKLGVKTFAEFLAYARANPGKLTMASAGSGGIPHLAGELLKREAKFDAVHVPYRGAAPAVNDLLAGQVDFMFADLPVLLPHIQAGKLIGLALGTAKRSPSLPDLPTTAEVGYPGVTADNWYGVFVPAGTPAEIQRKLHGAITASLNDPELQQLYAKQGGEAAPMTQAAFTAMVRTEGEKWGSLAKAVGAKFD